MLMMTYVELKQSETIKQLRNDYLRTLVAPIDGMWEEAIIAQATFWEIQDQGQYAGYFCLDTSNTLLRFHLADSYLARSQAIFQWIISSMGLKRAIASTIEPMYFSLCLDFQKNIAPHSFLFRDNTSVPLAQERNKDIFRKAERKELATIVAFYRANTEGAGEWIEEFLSKRIQREELFVLFDQHTLVATGECIPSQPQPPCTDLGMVVAQSYRGRGLATAMLIRLKQRCYEAGWKPICSCEASNLASKKAIEKAGFISEHRIVGIEF